MSEKEPYTSADYFTASNDIADSIKAEYSSVSPAEQEFANVIAQGVKDYIIHTYGEHISKDMKERLETAEKRIVMVDSEGFKKLYEDWRPESERPAPEAAAYFTRIGSMVVLNDMVERSKKIWNDGKEIFESLPENQQSAVLPYIRFSLVTETLVHELVHSCQEEAGDTQYKNSFRRWALNESGASYITGKIMEERYSKALPMVTGYGKARADTFNYLLGKYGEEVYDVFFSNVPKGSVGKGRYDELQKEIYAEFDTKKIVQMGLLPSDEASIYDGMSE